MTQAQFEAKLTEKLAQEHPRLAGLTKKDVQLLLDLQAEVVFEGLSPLKRHGGESETVVIRGLGRFSVQARAARMGRNPQTGAAIRIKASKKLKCLPNKGLRDRLKVK